MKTLVAHEWLAPIGGSENVFELLTQVVAGSDTACLWNDAPERFTDITSETWLANSPLRRSKALALPAMPSAWRRLPIDDYEQVVVSSHAFSHHLATRAARAGARSFAYVHTPARYIWEPDHDLRGRGPIVRAAARPLRHLDRRSTSDQVSYAANSRYIHARIKRAWDRDSVVIYPPVDVTTIQEHAARARQLSAEDLQALETLPATFVLGASRLISYKRLDKVIEIGRHLRLPVVIAGSGPDEARLRRIAEDGGTPVHFLGRVSTQLLHELYHRAALFVFLAVEDFGIMPVEAMAAGTPVLVNTVGGAQESVEITGGGLSIDPESSSRDLARAATSAAALDMTTPTQKTDTFSAGSFVGRIESWLAR